MILAPLLALLLGQSAPIGSELPGIVARHQLSTYALDSNDIDYGSPETPLCPPCAIFPALSHAPFGAKLALTFPFWLFAAGAVTDGFTGEISRRHRFALRWIILGIVVGLAPLFIGII